MDIYLRRHFLLNCNEKKSFFSLLRSTAITSCQGHVKKFVKSLFTLRPIYLLDMSLNVVDKLWVFRWGLTALPYFGLVVVVMRDISCFSLEKIKLMVL